MPALEGIGRYGGKGGCDISFAAQTALYKQVSMYRAMHDRPVLEHH
ncbi:hypothetical protein ACFS07_20090 [Undibacterium arcticum]